VQAGSTPDALWAAPSARLVQPAAVSCRDVGRGRLLRGCSFRVAPGVRLLVVAEPDDSGSALLRILAGLARPSSGRLVVAGVVGADAARHGGRVSYLAPEPGIHGWLTPREAVGLAVTLLGLDREEAERRTKAALAAAEIDAMDLDRSVRRGGPAVAQRTGLAAALVSEPEVLLLDEPLRALPPADRTRLLRIPGRRRTILIGTRHPETDGGLATHVMLLRDGRVAALAPIGQLEAAGLPLSREGIGAFAAHRGSGPPAGIQPDVVTAPR
jgi:ABC-2 type transport system ATP-binding protein